MRLRTYHVTLRGTVEAETASAISQLWIDEGTDMFIGRLQLWSIERDLDAIRDAAQRALEFLRDAHCDNQRDVIDELADALNESDDG